jgi:hypothetical protein
VTPTPSASRLAALVLVLAAVPASARIAVLPLSGPKNHTLERQLSSSICARMGCVPASTVMSGKKVDWDKVRRAKLEGVVVGGLSKATRPQVLEVSFLTPDGQRAWRQRYTVVNGRISSTTLGEIRDAVHTAAAGARAPSPAAAAAAAPPPPAAFAAAAAPPPSAPAAIAPPPGEIAPPPAGTEIAPPPAGSDIAPPPATAAAELGGAPGPDLVEIEIAAQLLHRNWNYSGYDPAGGLRAYTLSFFAEPRGRIGLYPLRAAEGVFASAGLELAGAVAVGTVVAGNDPTAPKFPLSLWWLDAGARVRFRLGSWTVGPGVGFRLSHQSVSPSSTGVTLDGIPTVNAKAVRLGFEAGGPIAGSFGLTAEFNYLLVLSTGLDTATFPDQSAGPSFEGRLGVTWQVSRPLRLFLAGTFSQERYNLNAPGSADSAQATVIGGELSFRVGF